MMAEDVTSLNETQMRDKYFSCKKKIESCERRIREYNEQIFNLILEQISTGQELTKIRLIYRARFGKELAEGEIENITIENITIENIPIGKEEK